MLNTFLRAIMAGVAISCGCVCFLAVGGVAGAVLFTFGFLTVGNFLGCNLYRLTLLGKRNS